ncbi:hypothetical protein CKAN_02714400 [Cinnamomum micranthum f. kanehirae]|uniref:Uncharacterized protein n=1 Tax=Cinnamomum micranthum f. kanehirae TaxID=337451 RepID=A0A3S4Q1S2_9MAGN|nr:hypothetical protein CKAN_02714400 [Cinnamomum micranthum f. kanehirae]
MVSDRERRRFEISMATMVFWRSFQGFSRGRRAGAGSSHWRMDRTVMMERTVGRRCGESHRRRRGGVWSRWMRCSLSWWGGSSPAQSRPRRYAPFRSSSSKASGFVMIKSARFDICFKGDRRSKMMKCRVWRVIALYVTLLQSNLNFGNFYFLLNS